MSEEEQETIDRLLKQEAALEAAPLGGLAKALREQGLKEDTELAHLRLGEVVLPPEFLEDDEVFSTESEFLRLIDETGIIISDSDIKMIKFILLIEYKIHKKKPSK